MRRSANTLADPGAELIEQLAADSDLRRTVAGDPDLEVALCAAAAAWLAGDRDVIEAVLGRTSRDALRHALERPGLAAALFDAGLAGRLDEFLGIRRAMAAPSAPPPAPGGPSAPGRPRLWRRVRRAEASGDEPVAAAPPPPPEAVAAEPPPPAAMRPAPARTPAPRKVGARKAAPRKAGGRKAARPVLRARAAPAKKAAKKAAAPRRPRAAAPPVAAERRLNVSVALAETGARREHAFLRGATHTIGVNIGPKKVGALTLAEPVPEDRIEFDEQGAMLTVMLVVERSSGTTSESLPLHLPPTGPSAVVEFAVDIPKDAKEQRLSVLLFQGARLIQSAVIEGPVGATDKPLRGRSLRIFRSADIDSTQSTEPVAGRVDASLSFHVGRAGEALLVGDKGKGKIVSINGLRELSGQIVTQLQEGLNSDMDGASPGSEQQVQLLRSLARRGNLLYQRLSEQMGKVALASSIQVTTLDDDVVPVELVYDLGHPSEKAVLCESWKKALRTGKCTCKRRTGEVRTICPLGFWGIRLTVERQLATAHDVGDAAASGQPQPGRTELQPLDRVLFAASERVDEVNADESAKTRALLTKHLGDSCVMAPSWPKWVKSVKNDRPTLLLALPHNEAAESDGLPQLEIGRNSRLDVGAVDARHVTRGSADEAGPVVFLLGCDTAHAEVPWQSAAAAFRRNGAALVVGTLAETLGRQTAPMTRMLAEALWGPKAVKRQTAGELLRDVRRRLLLDGATLGMSLVSFGHSSWTVPARKE